MKIDLFLGDCSEKLKEIPDASVDLVVTSPPYDNLREYKGYSFDFEKIASELYRVVADGGVVVWIVADATVKGSETGTSFRQALYFKEIGFNIHDTMIYLKNQLAFPDSTRYYNAFEYMFVFCKGKIKTFNPIKDRRNVSAGSVVHSTERCKDGSVRATKSCAGQTRGIETEIHPAVFPISLARDHIISWSNEGDTVLDPFMGSGTTGVAAHLLNRNFIGIEIAEPFFNLAQLRINNPNETSSVLKQNEISQKIEYEEISF